MPAAVYTREQKLQAVELAAVHGPTAASQALKIKPNTLRDWCYQDFKKEYADFRSGKVSEWRTQLAAELEDLTQNYAETEALALTRARELLADPDIDAKDVASLIKGMGAARASAAAVGGKARGEPDEVHQHVISFPDLERLEAALRRDAIEGTATEIHPGELNA